MNGKKNININELTNSEKNKTKQRNLIYFASIKCIRYIHDQFVKKTTSKRLFFLNDCKFSEKKNKLSLDIFFAMMIIMFV